jgi:hypothetical protein
MITDNKILLSPMSFHPNANEAHASKTRPINPLNLSRKTAAITSFGRFVCVDKSILRIRSPPIVEGRKRLKKIPPEYEMIILFKDKRMSSALSSICQRDKDNTLLSKEIINASNKKGMFACLTVSNIAFSSTCLNKKISKMILMPILNAKEVIFLRICI